MPRRLLILAALSCFLFAIGAAMQLGLNLLHSGLILTSPKGPGQVLFYLLMLAGLFGFVRYVWRPVGMEAAWKSYLSAMHSGRFWRGFSTGFGGGTAMMLLGFGLLLATGRATSDVAALGRMTGRDIGTTLTAMLVVPVLVLTEELIFRSIVYNYLRGGGRARGSTVTGAVLISAILFAYAHGVQFGFRWADTKHPALFVGLFLLGVLIALVYEVSGSLAAGMGVHTALIYAKIVPDRTGIVTLDQEHYWYMGVESDPRTGAYIWLLFVILIALTWVWRRRLNALAAIEPDKTDPPTTPSA